MSKKKNPHRGSKFEDYLAEEGLLDEVNAMATKRVLVWQLSQAMKKQRVTKSALAKRMGTSRAALDRLLDADNASVTLQTMGRAAAALSKQITISFKDAVRP
jgi:DNA-binding Xre family transcriptional regulator